MAYYPQLEGAYYATSGQSGGDYSYLDLNQLTKNFMVIYVGEGKIIKNANQVDVVFHARRGLAELNYDTLRSKSTFSMTLGSSMSMKLPNDFVNYVKVAWIDSSGIEHTIMPNRVTRNPRDPDQRAAATGQTNLIHDHFDDNGDMVLDVTDESTSEQLQNFDSISLPSDSIDYDYDDNIYEHNVGRRYGLEPEFSNTNGSFYIDHRTGFIRFSSDLAGKRITLQYISDGLGATGVDQHTSIQWTSSPIVHKFAEEALYKYIAYGIVNSGLGYSEAVIARYKKERFAETRKAKIRLLNLKFEEITQILRGQSKLIKH